MVETAADKPCTVQSTSSRRRGIAEALNARGIATARGGQWHAQSVANILDRS
jgi:hypothetical protein